MPWSSLYAYLAQIAAVIAPGSRPARRSARQQPTTAYQPSRGSVSSKGTQKHGPAGRPPGLLRKSFRGPPLLPLRRSEQPALSWAAAFHSLSWVPLPCAAEAFAGSSRPFQASHAKSEPRGSLLSASAPRPRGTPHPENSAYLSQIPLALAPPGWYNACTRTRTMREGKAGGEPPPRPGP